MIVRRRVYKLAAGSLIAIGFLLGVRVYFLDVGDYSYAFTLNPSQAQVYISTSTAMYSIVIFVCGALFSAGIAMVLELVKPEKE